MQRRKKTRGFTLIELLIVVAIIGIIAAIAIPNLLAAMQRSKQKRTMSDMRSLGVALEQYSVDFAGYPDGADIVTVTNYIDEIYVDPPVKDGWHTLYLWNHFDPIKHPGGQFWGSYRLTSFGMNTVQDAFVPGTYTRYFDCDIVYEDGQFLQSPDSTQKF